MSPEALATTETVRLPSVTLIMWRPCPALPVTVAEAVILTVPPPVLFTLTPAFPVPEPVTVPRMLIVFVVVELLSLM